MALISGRPISFQMDLYQPLYVKRPTVVPELFASLAPRTYEGKMDSRDQGDAIHKLRPAINPSAPQQDSNGGSGSGAGDVDPRKLKEIAEIWGHLPEGERVKALSDMTRDMPPRYRQAIEEYFSKLDRDGLHLGRGVVSAATGAQMGDSFQYRTEHPVSLPRQKSAILPILAKDVEATKASIFNETTHAKFPLLGLKFKNTSGAHLMQGPITVFENSTYAGDSRILDLQPNEERLLSYAIDLGTEIEATSQESNGKLTKVKLQKGILYSTTKIREAKTYKAKNRSPEDRLLIIEHPYRPEFTLVSQDKPSERARDVYRFEVKVPAGKTASMDVVEERDLVRTVQLTNSDDPTMRFFLSQTVSSDKVKAALQNAIELKSAHSKTQQDLAKVQQQQKEITDDQARLRANIKELPSTSPVYKKYLDKFEKQEGEIEEMQASVKKLQETEHTQRQEYENYLAGLDVE
jgi:hypothetical protein